MSALSDVQGKIAAVQAGVAARPATVVGGLLLDGLTAQVTALLLVTTQRIALQAAVTAAYNQGQIDAVVVALIAAEAAIAATANTRVSAVQAQTALL
jgi:hypothetical protein